MNKSLFFLILSLVFTPNYFYAEQLSQEKTEHVVGRHVIAELKGCLQCDYTEDIEATLRSAAEAAGATVLHIYVHKFSPQGMTAVVVLSESHIAFHTWPEFGYVACDIFTCGSNALPEKGLEVLINYFKPEVVVSHIYTRGS